MKFTFKAKTEAGEIKEGLVEALTREVAVQTLQKNNLILLSLTHEGGGKFLSMVRDLQKIWEGVSKKEMMMVFRQLATLISARVPVVTSLQTISDQVTNNFLRVILRELEEDIQDGMSFSEALERHPTVFSAMTINMIKAGEVSGSLQHSIEFVADDIEKNYRLNSKIRGALFYPAFVLLVAGIIGFLAVTFLLPQLTSIIKEFNVAIPWYTSVLIYIGDFMNQYWWAVLLVLFAAAGGFGYYGSTESGKREMNIVVLKLPIFKILFKDLYLTRLAENLAALLNSGIPVVRALIITSDVIGNRVYQGIILRAAEEVRTGGAMSAVFSRYPNEILPIVAQMVRIGEETGTMSQVLDGIAKFYNEEVESLTKNLTTLIEPVLIVFLGIGVAFLVVGILMPIYNIAGQI